MYEKAVGTAMPMWAGTPKKDLQLDSIIFRTFLQMTRRADAFGVLFN